MPFAQRENIQSFCDAVKALGVKDINNFAADDLYEAKNMKQVHFLLSYVTLPFLPPPSFLLC